MRRATIHVVDPAHDDFGTTSQHVTERVVDATYPYEHPLWWRVLSALFYYVILPLPAWVIGRVYGLRIVNRSALRRAGGCFVYANHTHWVDVIIPYLLAFPKRAFLVTGPVAVSVPVVRRIVPLAGGVPLNTTVAGKARFRDALERAVARGHTVTVFPEAHEWPYYNGIRDFSPHSFTYPVRAGRPVVAAVVTYRARRLFTSRPPHLTVTLSEPVWPGEWAGTADPKTVLRDKARGFMVDTVRERGSAEWVRYEIGS
ncbi:MAG: 1-acyl-sn-glycerol-3-phosphate acyltransferase [Propionibacteriaceae bacterium]|jgi:1-acyl-sn-glycerol-3-phosphate acyltransferase|nr:1-acyl-sn-glycerol-3-phosphate acyltransferase [Propionibacteriaceae bacterium]